MYFLQPRPWPESDSVAKNTHRIFPLVNVQTKTWEHHHFWEVNQRTQMRIARSDDSLPEAKSGLLGGFLWGYPKWSSTFFSAPGGLIKKWVKWCKTWQLNENEHCQPNMLLWQPRYRCFFIFRMGWIPWFPCWQVCYMVPWKIVLKSKTLHDQFQSPLISGLEINAKSGPGEPVEPVPLPVEVGCFGGCPPVK